MSHESDQFELPDDLQQLGFDLTRQAESLASAYPAKVASADVEFLSPKAKVSGGAGKALSFLTVGIALSGLFAATLIGLYGLPTGQSSDGPAVAVESPTIVETAMTPVTSEHPVDANPTRLYPVGIGLPVDGSSVDAPPALSSPEWEAILDLTPAEDWEGIELSL